MSKEVMALAVACEVAYADSVGPCPCGNVLLQAAAELRRLQTELDNLRSEFAEITSDKLGGE